MWTVTSKVPETVAMGCPVGTTGAAPASVRRRLRRRGHHRLSRGFLRHCCSAPSAFFAALDFRRRGAATRRHRRRGIAPPPPPLSTGATPLLHRGRASPIPPPTTPLTYRHHRPAGAAPRAAKRRGSRHRVRPRRSCHPGGCQRGPRPPVGGIGVGGRGPGRPPVELDGAGGGGAPRRGYARRPQGCHRQVRRRQMNRRRRCRCRCSRRRRRRGGRLSPLVVGYPPCGV